DRARDTPCIKAKSDLRSAWNVLKIFDPRQNKSRHFVPLALPDDIPQHVVVILRNPARSGTAAAMVEVAFRPAQHIPDRSLRNHGVARGGKTVETVLPFKIHRAVVRRTAQRMNETVERRHITGRDGETELVIFLLIDGHLPAVLAVGDG